MLDAGRHERFGSFAELNVWLLERCRTLWHELAHTEYEELSVAEMLEHEQPSLMPMINHPLRWLRRNHGQGLQYVLGDS